MRNPSQWMVCCALTLTLVGCTTSEQPATNEPVEEPVVTEEEPMTPPVEAPESNDEESDTPDTEVTEEPPTEEEPPAETPETTPEEEAPPVELVPKEPLQTNGQANLALDTLILVNKQIALPSNYKPQDLVTPNIDFVDSATGDRRMLRQEAASGIEALMTAAKTAGIDLRGTSAFRSYDYQVQLFNAYVARDGKEQAMKYSAPPGHSEHQTGLAIDVSSASVGYQLTQGLEQTKEGKWLADNAHKFGFIVRYQRAFEDETGYMYEPWHLRYIGVEHATNVKQMNVPFEEYLKQLMD
ncbi:D-alanyl-D-alanine carboxypeptidase family protein [Exiguobacterium sp. AB2]|uniref:M15 family metallopeptidase n=1 Tax=Exiguobacterium sp. AB2 TaxID=1484479 RepID=UPI0004A94123|nr:M15 family metallopeptidase [Exiguobacterium sp. AB2]KDN58964.1 peptidase M15B and M15C DD-carboxypeptidase VanY/endolysin [Exiguobacterium sp. AB2]